MVVCVGTFVMCLLEPEFSFLQLLFEVTSAFGTVGLSTGITPDLGIPGESADHNDYVYRQAGAADHCFFVGL